MAHRDTSTHRAPRIPARHIAATALVLFTATPVVAASELTLRGGAMARFTSAGGSFKVVKEKALTDFPDPRCPAPSSLQVTTSAGYDRVIELPCTQWSLSSNKFVYTDLSAAAGGVESIEWRSVRLRLSLGGLSYLPPAGPVTALQVRLTVGPDAEGHSASYCTRFVNFTDNSPLQITATGPVESCAASGERSGVAGVR